jgi:hypothetical protein
VEDIVKGKSQEYKSLVQEICEGRGCRCKVMFGRKGNQMRNKRTKQQEEDVGGKGKSKKAKKRKRTAEAGSGRS